MENNEMRTKIIPGFATMILLSASILMAQNAEKEKASSAAAEKWLVLVDEGSYAASWKEASGTFRTALEQERWEQLLWAVREPLGKVISRNKKSASYVTSPPSAPAGEYFVILFETSFENKKSAVETVISIRDKDGKWRVSGYGIQ